MPLPRLTPEALRAGVLDMCEEAGQMLRLAREAFLQPSPPTQARLAALAQELHRREKRLTDHAAMEIRERPWSLGSAEHLAFLPAGLERVGDCIEGLARCQSALHGEGLSYSERAIGEMMSLFGRAAALLDRFTITLRTGARDELPGLRRTAEEFEALCDAVGLSHQERVLQGICLPRASSIFLSMLDSFREIERYVRRMSISAEKALAG
jgi:Na+/phosphate symporter